LRRSRRFLQRQSADGGIPRVKELAYEQAGGSTKRWHSPGASVQARLTMTPINVKLTIKEVELLAALASDQLFRREFIDPKMPGYKGNSAEIGMGKALVARLRSILNPGFVAKTSTSARAARG